MSAQEKKSSGPPELIDLLITYKEDGRLKQHGIPWALNILTNPPPAGANYERQVYSTQEVLEGLQTIAPEITEEYCFVQDLMKDPNLILSIQEILQKDIVYEYRNRLILFLIVLSAKLLPRPLGAILLGASSSGKSQLMKMIEKHFPKGIEVKKVKETKILKNGDTLETEVERPVFKSGFAVVNLNDLTVAALCRISLENRGFFKGKCIMMGELPEKPTDDQIQRQQIIRQLISEGEYSRMIMGEDRRPMFLHLVGHPGFISADAKQKVEEQMANRVLLLSPDESQKQTKRIQIAQGLRHGEPWLFDERDKPDPQLQAIIANSDPLTVFNPWHKEIVEHLHERFGAKVQTRRLNELFFNFIEMLTLLMQHRRDTYLYQENAPLRYLKVEQKDIAFAFALLNPILEQTVSRVMESSFLYLEMIQKHYPTKEHENTVTDAQGETHTTIGFTENYFSRQQLAKTTKVSAKTLYPHLWNLVNGGFLRILDTDKKPHKFWLPGDNSNSAEDVLESLGDNPTLQLEEKEINTGLELHVSMSGRESVSVIDEPDFDTIQARLETSCLSTETEHKTPNNNGSMALRHSQTSSQNIDIIEPEDPAAATDFVPPSTTDPIDETGHRESPITPQKEEAISPIDGASPMGQCNSCGEYVSEEYLHARPNDSQGRYCLACVDDYKKIIQSKGCVRIISPRKGD